MKAGFRCFFFSLLAILFVFTLFTGSYSEAKETGESTVKLRLLETTDLHGYLVPYDYREGKQTNRFGLALTATLIKRARNEAENSMLFDVGDVLEGSALDEYIAQSGLEHGEIHPVYEAMNLLDYDAAAIGNHEFNFGLDFLNQAISGANFPYVNANLYYDDEDDNPKNDRHYFTPYLILPRTFTDENGRKHLIRVGVIGFVLPQMIHFKKPQDWLEGKLQAEDIYRTAKKYVPIMKRKGADVIVALSHSGLGFPKAEFKEKSASYDLTKVDGIDAVMFGHIHRVFPSDTFAGRPGVNLEKGTVNGVPMAEAGWWGNHLGVIDLTLKKDGNDWKVADAHSEAWPVYDVATGKALAKPDEEILNAARDAHIRTLNYLLTPAGQAWLQKQKR
jgi:2',3'-cyclic-nucleotide 2'-phosphodiesterase/3'-nucleotidase